MKQQGKGINPENLQEFLDTATNAAREGQQQFYTHPHIAASCSRPLPAHGKRQAVIDPTMGRGDLLKSSGGTNMLGIDVDARGTRKPAGAEGTWSVYQSTIQDWYPLAVETNLRADLWTLNPPFSLHWHTEPIAMLGDSTCETVKALYQDESKNGTIDSTLATLLIALDRSTYRGEGYLIMNADTYDKWLRFAMSEERWARLFKHFWAMIRISGPIWQDQLNHFDTAIVYWSADPHTYRNTLAPHTIEADSHTHDAIDAACKVLAETRAQHRGHVSGYPNNDTVKKWDAIRAELKARKSDIPPPYNISLDQDGKLTRYLTTFEHLTGKIPTDLIRDLDELQGKRPMSLVVQSTSRNALKSAVHHPAWRVDPAVLTAVHTAIEQYEAVRAPFFQPNAVQALGWIDEETHIECTVALPGTRFVAGTKYPITTRTEKVQWRGTKTNEKGGVDHLILSGSELAITIHESTDPDKGADNHGNPYTKHIFHVRAEDQETQESYPQDTKAIAHHHVSTLLDHFKIPRPKDIAQLNPEKFEANLAMLGAVEQFIST